MEEVEMASCSVADFSDCVGDKYSIKRSADDTDELTMCREDDGCNGRRYGAAFGDGFGQGATAASWKGSGC